MPNDIENTKATTKFVDLVSIFSMVIVLFGQNNYNFEVCRHLPWIMEETIYDDRNINAPRRLKLCVNKSRKNVLRNVRVL